MHSSEESSVMEKEPRHPAVQHSTEATGNGRTEVKSVKSFRISKREVFEAWKRVRKNDRIVGAV